MNDIKDKRVFLIGGPGGVGKTTLAAALAVRLAQQGHRTVVLTVDPARRLAQALGMDQFHTDLQQVPLERGELYASMLDTKHYFDKIIHRFAGNEEKANKVLHHPIYRTMVDSLGGTHEYAAMERLLEFATDNNYDKVVVDTPPSQNAIDLLSAPQRLADFMDNSVFRWFQGKTPGYLKIFKTGTKLSLTVFHKIFGADFMESLSELLENLSNMQSGFRQRHLDVIRLLQSPETSFLLVTAATEGRYRETTHFLGQLETARIPLGGIALNRLEPKPPTPDNSNAEVRKLLEYYSALYQAQQAWVERFKSTAKGLPLHLIPLATGGLNELKSLSQLAASLVSLEDDEPKTDPFQAPTPRP